MSFACCRCHLFMTVSETHIVKTMLLCNCDRVLFQMNFGIIKISDGDTQPSAIYQGVESYKNEGKKSIKSQSTNHLSVL